MKPLFGLAYMKAKKNWGPVFQGKFWGPFFGDPISPIWVRFIGPIPGPEIDHNRISKADAIEALVTSLSSQIMISKHFFSKPLKVPKRSPKSDPYRVPNRVPKQSSRIGPKGGSQTGFSCLKYVFVWKNTGFCKDLNEFTGKSRKQGCPEKGQEFELIYGEIPKKGAKGGLKTNIVFKAPCTP